jgi:hypothetical protein
MDSNTNKISRKPKVPFESVMNYSSESKSISISKTPNKTTKKAIDEARKGEVERISSVKQLFSEV